MRLGREFHVFNMMAGQTDKLLNFTLQTTNIDLLRRTMITKHETQVQMEQEARNEALAAKVNAATFEQVQSQLAADMDLLRTSLPPKPDEAQECAKDMKYIKTRQGRLSKGCCGFAVSVINPAISFCSIFRALL